MGTASDAFYRGDYDPSYCLQRQDAAIERERFDEMPIQTTTEHCYKNDDGETLVRRKGDKLVVPHATFDMLSVQEFMEALGKAIYDAREAQHTDEDIKSVRDDDRMHAIRDGEE